MDLFMGLSGGISFIDFKFNAQPRADLIVE